MVTASLRNAQGMCKNAHSSRIFATSGHTEVRVVSGAANRNITNRCAISQEKKKKKEPTNFVSRWWTARRPPDHVEPIKGRNHACHCKQTKILWLLFFLSTVAENEGDFIASCHSLLLFFSTRCLLPIAFGTGMTAGWISDSIFFLHLEAKSDRKCFPDHWWPKLYA